MTSAAKPVHPAAPMCCCVADPLHRADEYVRTIERHGMRSEHASRLQYKGARLLTPRMTEQERADFEARR